MNERLKSLRTDLGLTQTEFGERLGVTPTAISVLESGKRNLTEQMLLAICREFSVNEEWLRKGEGAMFVENDNTIIAALMSEYGLDELDQKILEAYLRLPEVRRGVIKEFVLSLARSLESDGADIAEELTPPPASASVKSDLYNRQLTAHEQAELLRARADAIEKRDAYSSTLEKRGAVGYK